MRITPLDVRKQEFRKAVRGYDCDEVRGFLTTLAEEYETVLVDNKNLRETIGKDEEKLGNYRQIEGNLRDTLMTAQRVMQDTKDNAAREGGLIVQEAQQHAQQILTECRTRTEELRREIIMLRKEKETYLARFRSLAEAQIQFVDTHESDFRDVDQRLLDLADSVVGGVQPVLPPRAFKPAEVHTVAATVPEVTSRDDVWRNYAPLSPAAPATPAAPPAPVTLAAQVMPAEYCEPAMAPDEAVDRVAHSLEAAVEMASKGIPVTAIPARESTPDQADGAQFRPEVVTGEMAVPV